MKTAKEPLLLYVHIPKTGGTSFTQAINEHCPNAVYYFQVADKPDLLRQTLKQADALCGHLPFGLHKATSRPCQYVTMLRDPVDQIASFFYFKYKNKSYLDNYNPYLTFEEFLNNSYFDPEYVNLQTRFLSGELWSTTPDLSLATRNLEQHVSFAGITELYAESQFLFMKTMGWEPKVYSKINANKSRPPKTELTSDIIDIIHSKNASDVELYYFARQLLLKKLYALSHASREELRLYKRNCCWQGEDQLGYY
ncbi:sulfotransferase family 2 domain-containing protein [Paenibacillus sp. FSL H8-0537]|uniref:sulfotransferase family 2 domain-containing protein n=1 Tax=Paenibacillus sp. FSL H8-0537 TaxID=2921399 RepID=UPI00310109CB